MNNNEKYSANFSWTPTTGNNVNQKLTIFGLIGDIYLVCQHFKCIAFK